MTPAITKLLASPSVANTNFQHSREQKAEVMLKRLILTMTCIQMRMGDDSLMMHFKNVYLCSNYSKIV